MCGTAAVETANLTRRASFPKWYYVGIAPDLAPSLEVGLRTHLHWADPVGRAMGKRGLKRKALAVDDLELTLSDLDEDRSPAHFVVDKLSADRRRITRDEHTIQVDNGKDKQPEQTVPDHEYFIPEFIDLDAEEFQPEKKSFGDQPSRKRRYISSVCYSGRLSLNMLLIYRPYLAGLAVEELVSPARRIFG
jgi:hypothetical protein